MFLYILCGINQKILNHSSSVVIKLLRGVYSSPDPSFYADEICSSQEDYTCIHHLFPALPAEIRSCLWVISSFSSIFFFLNGFTEFFSQLLRGSSKAEALGHWWVGNKGQWSILTAENNTIRRQRKGLSCVYQVNLPALKGKEKKNIGFVLNQSWEMMIKIAYQ